MHGVLYVGSHDLDVHTYQRNLHIKATQGTTYVWSLCGGAIV